MKKGLLIIAAALLLCGCRTTKYVAVPQQHTEHHWHTDSVHTTDSIYHKKETTIMQLDSAEMARYGIQMKQAERAWLVKSDELERQIQRLTQLSTIKGTVRDSIPYPVKVEKEVPAPLTWWQKTRIILGSIAIGLWAVFVICKVGKWHLSKIE